MAVVYVNQPFTLEGRMDDPDNFPNPILSYAWSVVTQPAGAIVSFFNTVSITPSVLVDTAGYYVVELTAFDGKDSSSVTHAFNAYPFYTSTSSLSGTCSGSGVSNSAFVHSSSTSIVSQNDADFKAVTTAAASLNTVLNCCPTSFQLGIPTDAPSGSSYSVYVLPSNSLPYEDFGSDFLNSSSGITSITSITIPDNASPGASIELSGNIPPLILNANQSVTFIVVANELSPVSGLTDVSDFNVTIASNGNATGITATKCQRHAASFPVQKNRSLAYKIFVPQPRISRFSATIQDRVPPLPVWQINAAGWDTTRIWAGNTVNSLGLFLLTGGTLTVPLNEVLIMGMNSSNTDLNLCSNYYDFFGFSQIPYQGSLYSSVYSDRNAFAPIPRTGFVGTKPSTIYSWAQALIDYVNLHNVPLPYSIYFRSGSWSSGIYTWYPDSVPLYLERNAGAITLGSLTANPAASILSALNSVLTISITDLTSYFFATIRAVPSLYFDMFRWNTLFPLAISVGVYQSNGTWITSITPNVSAGRGYDCTNLAQNPVIQGFLKTGSSFSLTFNFEIVSGTPAAPFPLTVKNLTSFAPVSPMYSVSNNVLTIFNSSTKLYICNSNG